MGGTKTWPSHGEIIRVRFFLLVHYHRQRTVQVSTFTFTALMKAIENTIWYPNHSLASAQKRGEQMTMAVVGCGSKTRIPGVPRPVIGAGWDLSDCVNEFLGGAE